MFDVIENLARSAGVEEKMAEIVRMLGFPDRYLEKGMADIKACIESDCAVNTWRI